MEASPVMVRKRVGLFLIRVAFLFQTVLAGSIQPELPSSSDFDTVRAALKITFPDPDLRLSGPAAPVPGCGPETAMNETLQGNPLKICETSGLAPLRGSLRAMRQGCPFRWSWWPGCL